MQFKDIRYSERYDKQHKGTGCYMPGNFWVYQKTMEAAWKKILENWHRIDWSTQQFAEALIGPEYWRQQSYGTRLALGRCVKFFAVHGMLPRPLEVANPSMKGKRLYRPKKR